MPPDPPDQPEHPDRPDHRLTPEERYLQKKLAQLAELEGILAERELELHTLRGGLLAFEKQYEAAVGAKFAELDELKLRLAELIPSSPAPAPSPTGGGDAKTQGQRPSGSSRSRARLKAKSSAAPAPPPSAPPTEFKPTRSLKQLYRDVAKSMHPDLADTEQARLVRHEFMIRANQAYEAGDEAGLLSVFQEWEHSPAAVAGDGAAADLVRAIRKIDACERRLFAIGREIEELQTTGLFGMKMMSEEARQFERDLMAEMTARIDADIAIARQQLAALEQRASSDPRQASGG
jgi:hypothetical protein